MAIRRKYKKRQHDHETFEQSKKSRQVVSVEKGKDKIASAAADKSEGSSTHLESKSTQSTRTPRGRTHMDRLAMQRVRGIKKDVSFNGLGQPLGRNAAEMQSYIGVLAREKVKITYRTWKQVPYDVKESIWESVILMYNVDPKWKKGCLSSANDKWRQYKTHLTQKFILKRLNSEKLNNPPSGYGIPAADWSQFVSTRMSEDFMKLSEQQRERRKQNQYPHRLARKGYARFAEEIADELCDDDEVNRFILWKKGRLNKKGEFEGDDLKTTVEKIDDYIAQKKEGKLRFKGPKDVTIEQQKELMEVKKKISEQDARIEKLEAMVYKTGARDTENDKKGSCLVKLQCPMNEDDVKAAQIKENDEEFDDDDDDDEEEEEEDDNDDYEEDEDDDDDDDVDDDVQLLDKANALQGAPSPKNCMHVAVDQATDVSTPLPVPIPSKCHNIGDAIRSHVAEKPSRKKVGHQQKKPTLQSSSVPRSLYILYCYCKHALDGGGSISLSLDYDVFGTNSVLHVYFEDIIPYCKLEPISYNCIVVYIWHLYKKMKEENKLENFRFVDPYHIGYVPTTRTDESYLQSQLEKRAHALADRLSGTSINQLVLVPCNVNCHWILTVIDPYKEVVSLLDPLSHRIQDEDWKHVVNLALKLFNAKMRRKGRKQPLWQVVKAPLQPDAKQCGFYVMRYMRQIIEEAETIEKASLRSIFTQAEYSPTEIDEVRSEWAECIQDHIHE